MEKTKPGIKILYVEDDKIDALHLKREFQKIDPSINIEIFSNGIDALDALCGKNNKFTPHPDVLLLDNNLPQMSGIEFLTTLRAIPKFASLIVFLITSNYTTENKLAVRDLNVSGSIVKPLQHADALNILWCVNSDPTSAELLF